jgi:plasmid stabilization system protein ParE
MKISYDPDFTKKLERQIHYIAGDKPLAAKKFKRDVISRIKSIPKNPKIYRKSFYFDDENIRDLIFKGYTISFKITKNEIIVFGFLKWEEEF